MGDVLDGYIDKIGFVWVDDIIVLGETSEIRLKRPLAILDRLVAVSYTHLTLPTKA